MVSDALSSGETRRGARAQRRRIARARVREEKRAVRDARARDRAMRQVSLRTPEPRGGLVSDERTDGAASARVRATRGAWGTETRDPRWNTRVHRRDASSSADASGRDAARVPRVRASAVGWAGTHQLARALAFALVLSEPVLGELLIALQAAQPLDRLGDVLADVARRLHGRAREKHGHLDRRLRC